MTCGTAKARSTVCAARDLDLRRRAGMDWYSTARSAPTVVKTAIRRLLDDSIRSRQHRLMDRHSQRFRSAEIDHQLELRRLLDGEVGGLGSSQDLVDMSRGAPGEDVEVRAVAHQAACVHPRAPARHHG